MKFTILVFLICAIFWLLDLVVEVMKEIVTKLSRLLQILIVLAVLFFLLYTYIAFEGNVSVDLKKENVFASCCEN